jgi:hypothetical protein
VQKTKTNPERKTNKHLLMNPVSNCQALLLPAIIIMFLSRRSNLSVAACHTCDSFLHSDSQLPKNKSSLNHQKVSVQKLSLLQKLSLYLSLSLCLCLCPTLNPKIQGNPNGTLCHKRELSAKSPSFHPIFGPGFTPYPLFQWYLQSKGNSVVVL